MEGNNEGIAEVTLRRAKEKLRDEGRLFVEKQPGVLDGPWVWSLTPIQWDLPLEPL